LTGLAQKQAKFFSHIRVSRKADATAANQDRIDWYARMFASLPMGEWNGI
jgi:hypothetical protein